MKGPLASATARAATPMRSMTQRFSSLLLIIAAGMLMLVAKVDTVLIENIRTRVADVMAPIVDIGGKPMEAVGEFLDSVGRIAELEAANARLTEENNRLRRWYEMALRLEAENRSLRDLMQYSPPPTARRISAQLVTGANGPYVRSLIVTAGSGRGVEKGQATMAGNGLVGRVVEVGERTARVLLITDLNSRIPVMVEHSRERAILVGTNGEQPQLAYVDTDAAITVGDRIVTSGAGGMFPAGLPVGVVAGVSGDRAQVQPYADLARMEQVQIVNYDLPARIRTLDLRQRPL